MKKLKCEHCIHKNVCIDGANYRNAERCRNFINEKDYSGGLTTDLFSDRANDLKIITKGYDEKMSETSRS